MANPQSDKFVRISSEILDALCKIRISGEARQILDSIIRQTWGYNQRCSAIALDKFVTMTGLKKPTIIKAVKKLIRMNLITQKDNRKYEVQKDYDRWKPLPKKITITQKDNPRLPKKITRLPKKVISTVGPIDTLIDIQHIDIHPRRVRLQDIRDLVEHYKKLKKVDKDPNWNETFFAHYAKRAKQLINYVGNLPDAIECMNSRVAYLEKIKYSWAFETIIKYAQDWKRDRKQNLEAESKRKQETAQAAEFAKKNME